MSRHTIVTLTTKLLIKGLLKQIIKEKLNECKNTTQRQIQSDTSDLCYIIITILATCHKKAITYKLKTIQQQLINATVKATGQNYKFHPNNL